MVSRFIYIYIYMLPCNLYIRMDILNNIDKKKKKMKEF